MRIHADPDPKPCISPYFTFCAILSFQYAHFLPNIFPELAFHESTEIPEMESEENTTRVQASLGGKQTYRTGAK